VASQPRYAEGGETIARKVSPLLPFSSFLPLLLWRSSGSQIFCVQYNPFIRKIDTQFQFQFNRVRDLAGWWLFNAVLSLTWIMIGLNSELTIETIDFSGQNNLCVSLTFSYVRLDQFYLNYLKALLGFPTVVWTDCLCDKFYFIIKRSWICLLSKHFPSNYVHISQHLCLA
jgi:hypothetical protein